MNAMVQRGNFALPCRTRGSPLQEPQFIFRHSEFRVTTIQTDNKLWEYPHDGLVNGFQTRKMDGYLPADILLVG
jgi:hypothetical protein